MEPLSRRQFIALSAMGTIGSVTAQSTPHINMAAKNGIRIKSVQAAFEEFRYRSPYKFGGVAVDRVTLLNVHVEVTNAAGKTNKGFGSMPLGNIWSYPSKEMPYNATLQAMKELAQRIAKITESFKELDIRLKSTISSNRNISKPPPISRVKWHCPLRFQSSARK